MANVRGEYGEAEGEGGGSDEEIGKVDGIALRGLLAVYPASDFGYLLRIGVDLQFHGDGGKKVSTPLSAHVGISSIEAVN